MISSNERQYWIDAIRSFACICVLMTHSPIPSTESGRIALPMYNFCSMGGASILFFMISGALVLYKAQSFHPFIKKRISRIVLPMVIWTIISLLIGCLEGKMDWSQLLEKIVMIPFSPQVGTYWFIYVIFGIYLLTPVLSTWLAHTSKRDVKAILLLWSITLLLPYIQTDISDSMKSYDGGYLYYFYGYLGFAVLGYYLRRYFNFDGFSWRLILVPTAVILGVVLAYQIKEIPHSVLQNRMALHTVVLAGGYFVLIKHFPLNNIMKRMVYVFAQHSFGIYLVHILVMRSVLWPILEPLQINHFIAVPLITFLTATLSFLLVWTIGKFVPYSKYIVGV